MIDRIPLVCLCGLQPVTLRLGEYCESCHTEDEDAVEPEPYLPDPHGDAYDKARDQWEQQQEDHAAHKSR